MYSDQLVTILDSKSILVKNEQTNYTFDRVFKPDDTQSYIYEVVGKQTVKDILDGYNGTIFAYGQTNSGKTYTMFGDDVQDEEMRGIIPRIGEQIFSYIEAGDENVEFEIRCSILEIYKENLRDLLNRDNNNLRIKESPTKGIFVEGLADPCVSTLEEMHSIISIGQQMREVGTTRLNAQSSRSHAIFIMKLLQKYSDGIEKRGILNLIDLAGSESVSKSGAEGKSLEEAKKINLSLSALCNVIHALTSSCDHIPYRDSKLTRILQESLGGNFKTTLIITCSSHPAHLQETLSSLKFGRRAKAVKNNAKININQNNENYELIIQSIRAELAAAKNEIKHLKNGSDETVNSQYPPEILLNSGVIQENDNMRITLEKYKVELSTVKSENKELQSKLDYSIAEIKKLKIDKFNIEKKCIEYEQVINTNKLKEITQTFQIKKENIEIELFKKEINSLSDAFNEIESELYKALKERHNNIYKSVGVLKSKASDYLGKQFVENSINKQSFITSIDIQKQLEIDRQFMKDIIEIPLDETELLRKTKHSNELLNSIEDNSVSKELLIHLLKANIIDLAIYNHSLQRILVSMQWRQIIEFSKGKVKHELYNLVEVQLKQVETMLEAAHQSQNKLLKKIEKCNETSFLRPINAGNLCTTRSKIQKTTSKYSLVAYNNYNSTRNVLGNTISFQLQRIEIT